MKKISLLYVLTFALIFASCDSSTDTATTDTKPTTGKVAPKTSKKTTPSAADTGDGIKWYTIQEAEAMTKKEKKKIFVDVYTHWCGWCKRMDATTFKDPAVVAYINENYYPVKFNAEIKEEIEFNGKKHQFVKTGRRGINTLAAEMLGGRASYPSFVLLDDTYKPISVIKGYQKPDQLISRLKAIQG